MLSPRDGDLRRAAHYLNHHPAEGGPGRRLVAARTARKPAGQDGNQDPGGQEDGEEHRRCGRQDQPGGDDEARAGDQGDEGRKQRPQVEVLKPVGVGDEAGQ